LEALHPFLPEKKFDEDSTVLNDLHSFGESLYRLVRHAPNVAHVLNSYGFCLFTTPATYRDPRGGFSGRTHLRDRGMHLCTDRPEDPGTFHNDVSPSTISANASPFEIHRRLEMMKEGLLEETNHPEMITICRSIRDGYSNPLVWELVESGLLKMLGQVYGELEIVYDKNLLGGKQGWNNHAKPIL
jgi:hypothetical protein